MLVLITTVQSAEPVGTLVPHASSSPAGSALAPPPGSAEAPPPGSAEAPPPGSADAPPWTERAPPIGNGAFAPLHAASSMAVITAIHRRIT
jgi:hypothetical protein